MFSKETYRERREKLRSRVDRGGVILLLGNVSSPRNYPKNAYHFRQDSSFLYFFGINQANLIGIIDVDKSRDMVYGNDLTMDDIIWTGPQPTISDLASKADVSETGTIKEAYDYINMAIRKGRPVHILPPYRAENKLRLSEMLGVIPSALDKYVSIELALAIVSLRDKKSAEEIVEIERACEIGYKMHTTAMKMCRPGVVEREIAGAIEGIALQLGAGVSFSSIVSQNGETLHNEYYGNTLESGKLMLCDAGAETTTNYCSDFTRTYPVSGKFTEKQKEIYNLVLAGNDHAFKISKPGMLYKDIHVSVCRLLTEGLMELGIMKGNLDEAVEKSAYALFMPHGLGHMMGLDVHDMEDFGEDYVGYDLDVKRSKELGVSPLRMGRRLEPGMVMTVEPGLYFIPAYIEKWKEDGLNSEFINFDRLKEYYDFGGIRIEDDLLITEEGNRMLGKRRVPVTVKEIEEFMADN